VIELNPASEAAVVNMSDKVKAVLAQGMEIEEFDDLFG
jgi:hypothetical protein